jgi:class 3 adenylate cyclase
MGDRLDIGAWLRGLGLERYEPAFRGNDIDADLLPGLTAEELRDIGVASVGHRRRLLDAIAALRTGAGAGGGAGASARRQTGTATAPPACPRAERRHVTVLFADLAGSTALARSSTPRTCATPARLRGAVVDEVARLGGHAAKFAGDGVLAFFGWPRAHEDDAERAIRAGLAIAEAVGRLAAPGGAPLAARVGIATGPVVVGELQGRRAGRGRTWSARHPTSPPACRPGRARRRGDRAVHAPPRRRPVRVRRPRAPRLKGFAEPVRAWRVLGPGRAAGASTRARPRAA